jgi:hypothetical protein
MTVKGGIVQEGRLRYFAYSDFVLLAVTPAAAYKIARVTFGKDGSIYVQFPYCAEKQGWIGILPIDPSNDGPTTYKLSEHGSFVATDVKFAHHVSGEAHFSKTGDATIHPTRRVSWPLTGPLGHLFVLQVIEPERFARLENPDKRAKYLAVRMSPGATSISWHAEWRRKRDVEQNIQPAGDSAGPTTTVRSRRTGEENAVIFLGQPEEYGARDHVLMLTSGSPKVPSGFSGTGMTFLGGWDVHEVANTGDRPEVHGCLAFVYPVSLRSADASLPEAHARTPFR